MTIDEKNLIKGLKRRDEFYLKTFIHGYGGLMKSVIYPYFPNSPEDREEVLNDAIGVLRECSYVSADWKNRIDKDYQKRRKSNEKV